MPTKFDVAKHIQGFIEDHPDYLLRVAEAEERGEDWPSDIWDQLEMHLDEMYEMKGGSVG